MSYTSAVLADSPAAYYLLDEPSGSSMADSSGNSLTATLNDAFAGVDFFYGQTGPITSDASNKAMDFRVSPYLNLGNSAGLQITGAITLEVWIKPHAWPTGANIHAYIAKGYDGTNEGYQLSARENAGNPVLSVYGYDGVIHGAEWVISGITLDTWHHIVGRYTGSAWQILVDGVQVATTNSGTGAVATASNASMAAEYIAAGTGSPGRPINAMIARPAIYATSLSDARVTAHYNAATGAGTPTIGTQTISTAGNTLVWVANASLSDGGGGKAGVTLSASGGAVTATYSSGAASDTIIYSLSRTIAEGETVTCSYTQPGNGWEATSGGADVATFAGASVTNNAINKPTLLVSTGVTSTAADFSWSDNSSVETGYTLETATDSSFAAFNTFTFLQNATAGSTTATLQAATDYWARLEATNSNGASQWSSNATFSTATGGIVVAGTGSGHSSLNTIWITMGMSH